MSLPEGVLTGLQRLPAADLPDYPTQWLCEDFNGDDNPVQAHGLMLSGTFSVSRDQIKIMQENVVLEPVKEACAGNDGMVFTKSSSAPGVMAMSKRTPAGLLVCPDRIYLSFGLYTPYDGDLLGTADRQVYFEADMEQSLKDESRLIVIDGNRMYE